MVRQSREETAKVRREPGLHRHQNGRSLGQRIGPTQTPSDADKRPSDAGVLTVAAEQIISLHVLDVALKRRRHMAALTAEVSVYLAAEIGQRLIHIIVPVPGQQMIVIHVDQDPGITPKGRLKASAAAPHRRVAVGECVDAAVQAQAVLQARGKALLEAAPNEIAHEIAGADHRIHIGEKQMREVIHNRSMPAKTPAEKRPRRRRASTARAFR